MSELAIREPQQPQALTLSNDQLKFIAATEFVPQGLRGNLPAILACVATGRALGISDMAALRSIHIIEGRASFSAELMVALVRRRGHSITGEVTADKAVVRGKRADNGDEMGIEWTTAMAERAGLLSKATWRKYTESLLWARAVSQLCRMLFADVFAGQTYTPEEIEGEVLDGGDVGAPPPSSTPPADAASQQQHAKLAVLVRELEEVAAQAHEDSVADWTEWTRWAAREQFGVESRGELSKSEMSWLIEETDRRLTMERAPF